MVEWIQTLLGMMSSVGQGMGVLHGGGDRQRGWILGIPLQLMGTLLHSCATAMCYFQI